MKEVTLQELANRVLARLETKTRDNGNDFISLSSGTAPWMKELARTAHAGMLPDDFKYAFIQEALQAISEHDDADDALDSLEADVYNADLLAWLSSNLTRSSYVDEAVSNFGAASDTMQNIQMGQVEEKREVFNLVRTALEEQAAEEVA